MIVSINDGLKAVGYMATAIAPIPMSSFAGQPSSSIGIAFLKSYAAICMEGCVIVLACVIFSAFASTPPAMADESLAAATIVWNYVGELLFNMLVLVGAIMGDKYGRVLFLKEYASYIQERQTAAVWRAKDQRRAERTAAARQRDQVDIPLRRTSTRSGQPGEKPARRAVQETVSGGKRQVKAACSGVKATGRTSRQAVETAAHTARTAVKTAERGAKTAQKAAQTTVKATRQAVQAARAPARTAATSTKAVAKATVSAIKAAIAATQEVPAAIATGGGAVVAVVLVLCLTGALLMSLLGIFFSGTSNGTDQTISSVVREIDQEYDARVETLKTGTAHDELSLSGSRATWPEVLAVYAVKTTSDPANGLEVVTMNDEKRICSSRCSGT